MSIGDRIGSGFVGLGFSCIVFPFLLVIASPFLFFVGIFFFPFENASDLLHTVGYSWMASMGIGFVIGVIKSFSEVSTPREKEMNEEAKFWKILLLGLLPVSFFLVLSLSTGNIRSFSAAFFGSDSPVPRGLLDYIVGFCLYYFGLLITCLVPLGIINVFSAFLPGSRWCSHWWPRSGVLFFSTIFIVVICLPLNIFDRLCATPEMSPSYYTYDEIVARHASKDLGLQVPSKAIEEMNPEELEALETSIKWESNLGFADELFLWMEYVVLATVVFFLTCIAAVMKLAGIMLVAFFLLVTLPLFPLIGIKAMNIPFGFFGLESIHITATYVWIFFLICWGISTLGKLLLDVLESDVLGKAIIYITLPFTVLSYILGGLFFAYLLVGIVTAWIFAGMILGMLVGMPFIQKIDGVPYFVTIPMGGGLLTLGIVSTFWL